MMERMDVLPEPDLPISSTFFFIVMAVVELFFLNEVCIHRLPQNQSVAESGTRFATSLKLGTNNFDQLCLELVNHQAWPCL